MKKLLDSAPHGVNKTVYVRWRMQDLLCRATDPEIFDVAKNHQARLLYHPGLHAKAYITDSDALVGSANATGPGLGMTSRSNLELLVPADASSPWIDGLLSILENEARVAIQVPTEQFENRDIKEPLPENDLKPDRCWVPISNYNDTVAFIQNGTWNQLAAKDCIALGLSAGASEDDIRRIANNTEVFQQLTAHLGEKLSGLDKESLSKWLVEFSGNSMYRDPTLCSPLINWLYECSTVYVLDYGTSEPKITPWSTTKNT